MLTAEILVLCASTGERERIYAHTIRLVERILQARKDEELAEIIPDMVTCPRQIGPCETLDPG